MNVLDQLSERSTAMVEQFGIKYYWEVDGYKLCNKHLTTWYERERNCWATFVAQQFSSIKSNLQDHTIDMERDYNVEYLQKLRHEHEYIQLFFSGGSDSITVLDKAVSNNIYIDEIICLIIEDLELQCNQEIKANALPYLEPLKDRFNKLTVQNTSFDMLTKLFSDPYAFFTMATALKAPMNIGRPFISAHYRPLKENSCYIKCADKPTLVSYKGDWYATFIDGAWGGNNDIHNLLYFWLEGDNIKSFIKDARLYRDYLKENHVLGKHTKFYKADPLDRANSVIRKNPTNTAMQFKKNFGNDKIDDKYASRFIDALNAGRYDLLGNYFRCLEQFYNIFPETRNQGFVDYNNNGKFAWFINIDTLEVFTQKQLIPNGFEQ